MIGRRVRQAAAALVLCVATASAAAAERVCKQWKAPALNPDVADARASDIDPSYARGFDIGTGLFGDPSLGAVGNTATGPGSLAIRATLDAGGQRGFDASVEFHLARDYRH